MAEFLAYRVLAGKLAIDEVPPKLKTAVQDILDKQDKEEG